MLSGIYKWLHFRLHKKVLLHSLQSVNLKSYVQIFVQGVQPRYSCELLHGPWEGILNSLDILNVLVFTIQA